MATAEPAGYSLVSSLGSCVGPWSPGLKRTLLALTSWADGICGVACEEEPF